MPILPLDPAAPDPETIERAAARLRAGELVAFPTETVYGLGAHALDPRAVAKIYAAKGRPSFNPLIVHVASVAAGQALVTEWPSTATRLAETFWPGPLTFVLPKRPEVPDLVTAGLPSVALRSPDHPVARALLERAGPTAAPSANRYQSISPTTAAHVSRSLGPEIWVLDGGPTRVGIESTVIDLRGEQPALLRLGGLPVEAIEAIVGPLTRPEVPEGGSQARVSPGQVGRHYAPRGQVELVERQALLGARQTSTRAGPTGVIALGQPVEGAEHSLCLPADASEYARLLYAALHTLDELACARILIEAVPNEPAWAAVRDRLRRATIA